VAVLDPHSDAVVVRIVYDGAPLAGKTSSLSALGKSLGAGVVTPAEVGGRTLYFDWLDYTGGLFEGRKIRCQVISVPGQATLAPRRRRLLEEADAIVFVGDSTPAGFHADRGYLGGLAAVLDKLPGPPIGIVLQANKRDHPQAVPIEEIQSLLAGLGLRLGVVESVAIEGTGIREAFVFAVRLALDRVRELMRTGKLQSVKPSVNSAQDLLDELKRSEGGSLEFAAASGLAHTRLADVQAGAAAPQAAASPVIAEVIREAQGPPVMVQASAPVAASPLAAAPVPRPDSARDTREPIAPDERVASGFVWPPIDGRLILHELSGRRISLDQNPRGDWWGIVNDRWRLTSPADAVYADVELGRSVLVKSARAQAARADGRTADRCVVLAADGAGRFRLWNITRVGASDAAVETPAAPAEAARS
jgi:signal recognition particle receptor subunit beta